MDLFTTITLILGKINQFFVVRLGFFTVEKLLKNSLTTNISDASTNIIIIIVHINCMYLMSICKIQISSISTYSQNYLHSIFSSSYLFTFGPVSHNFTLCLKLFFGDRCDILLPGCGELPRPPSRGAAGQAQTRLLTLTQVRLYVQYNHRISTARMEMAES